MRDLFPGYYGPTRRDFERIWREGIFALDANVLLDVYRFSDETVQQLLGTLERLRTRLWIPHQAALEYHRNLTSVVSNQQRPYSDALNTLRQFRNALESPREHPFIDQGLLAEVQPLFQRIEADLNERQSAVLNLLNENPIKDRLADLLDGCVGPAYTEEQLDEIYREGAERYSHRIPPGYSDVKDKPEPERYGDLVLWKQVLDRARGANRPLVLVTRDVKEDWFLRASGRTISPRPELISEVRMVSEIEFYIYTTPAFLQYANEYLGAGVPTTAINEVLEAQPPVVNSPNYPTKSEKALKRKAVRDYFRTTIGPNARVTYLEGPYENEEYWGGLSDGRIFLFVATDPESHILYSKNSQGQHVFNAFGPRWGNRLAKYIGTPVTDKIATERLERLTSLVHSKAGAKSLREVLEEGGLLDAPLDKD